MEKKISVREYIEEAKKNNHAEGIVVQDIMIDKNISKTKEESREIIEKELQDYFSLLDLGITALEEMHKVCKEKSFLYACLSGKLVSQLLSMRILLQQGMMDSVKTIHRAFHETIEVFFACLIDENFAEEYGKLEKLYDNNKFWKEKINNNKLDKYINKIFDELEYPRESKKEYFKRRDSSKAFLSESVHATINSAFSAYLMSTMDGKWSTNIYGKITTAYPMMMYQLLTDMCLINAVFFLAVDKEKAFAFKKEDFIGEKWLKYHYYMKLYDVAYDYYFKDLYKKAYDIWQLINQAYEYYKQIEEKEKCL